MIHLLMIHLTTHFFFGVTLVEHQKGDQPDPEAKAGGFIFPGWYIIFWRISEKR